MQIPPRILEALEKGKKIVGTVETELEDHTSWVSILPLIRETNFPLPIKNGQEAKYRIDWIELSDKYMELFAHGGDIVAREEATHHKREYAVSLEELETLLLERLTDLSKLKLRKESRINYPP